MSLKAKIVNLLMVCSFENLSYFFVLRSHLKTEYDPTHKSVHFGRIFESGFDIFKILTLYFGVLIYIMRQRKFSAKITPHYAILIEPNKIFVGHDDCVSKYLRFRLPLSLSLNGNSATKQPLNYHLSHLDQVGKMTDLQFGDKTVTELPFGCLTDFF